MAGLVGVDYVKEVTHKAGFRWDEKDEQSASFKLAIGNEPANARQLRSRCRRRTFPSSPSIMG